MKTVLVLDKLVYGNNYCPNFVGGSTYLREKGIDAQFQVPISSTPIQKGDTIILGEMGETLTRIICSVGLDKYLAHTREISKLLDIYDDYGPLTRAIILSSWSLHMPIDEKTCFLQIERRNLPKIIVEEIIYEISSSTRYVVLTKAEEGD